jgi:hypothetical protein
MSDKTNGTIGSQHRIDQLEEQLGSLAMAFRTSAEDSPERADVVRQYHQALQSLLEIEEWCGTPDLDSQLPDEFIPEVYHRHGNGKFAAGTARDAKSRASKSSE